MASHAYQADIDGLRCIAVMSVLLAHAGVAWFPGGYLGVDVFFVISGFLITGLIRKGTLRGGFSFREFYMRRVRRLAPAMLVTLAATWLLFAAIMPPPDLKQLSLSAAFAVASLSNVYFFLQVGYFDTEAAFKPLLHMWSLGVEEQFYLLWPITAWATLRWAPRLFWPLIAALAVASFAAAELYYDRSPAAVYYLLPFRAGELLVGALALAAVERFPARGRIAEAGLALGLILIALSVVLLNEETRIPGLMALPPCLGAALALWSGAAAPWVGRLLTNRPVVWIGVVSYSLYLVHWPVMVFWRYVTSHVWSLPEQLALIAVCLVLAAALNRWVETPFRRMPPASARPGGNRRFLIGAGALAALCLAPGVAERLNMGHDWLDLAAADKLERMAPDAPARTGYTATLENGRSLHLARFAVSDEKVRALMLGDSHAGAILPGLTRLLPANGIALDVSTQPACPPLFGVVPRSAGEEHRGYDAPCRRRLPDWRALSKREDYDAVMLVSRWYWLVEPEEENGVRFPQRGLALPSAPEETPDLERSRARFRSSLQETVAQLRRTGKRVVLFSQTPPPGVTDGRCTALIDGGENAGRCRRLDAAGQAKRAAYTETVMAEIAASDPGVLFVPMHEIFCDGPQDRCRRTFEGSLLYRYDNHLSELGGIWSIAQAERAHALTAFLLGQDS